MHRDVVELFEQNVGGIFLLFLDKGMSRTRFESTAFATSAEFPRAGAEARWKGLSCYSSARGDGAFQNHDLVLMEDANSCSEAIRAKCVLTVQRFGFGRLQGRASTYLMLASAASG